MELDTKTDHRSIAWRNAISVLTKIVAGSIIIMFVGICAYMFLLTIMVLF